MYITIYIYICAQYVCSLPFSRLTVKPTRLRAVVYSTLRFHHLCIRPPCIMYSTCHAVAPRVPCIICVFLPLPMAMHIWAHMAVVGPVEWENVFVTDQFAIRSCLLGLGDTSLRCTIQNVLFEYVYISAGRNIFLTKSARWYSACRSYEFYRDHRVTIPPKTINSKLSITYIRRGHHHPPSMRKYKRAYTHHAYKTSHKMYAHALTFAQNSLTLLVRWSGYINRMTESGRNRGREKDTY